MAYKCPDCNTFFYGDFCPKCAKSAADCIEMSELEIEEDKKAVKKKEKAGGEGQAVCPKCGRVFEGLFCPFCGYGAEEAGIERLEDEEVAAQEEAFRQEDKRAEEEKKREEQEQAAAAAAAEKAEEEAVASGEKTKCPKCGKVVEGTFCPYCGTQVQQQNKCPHCGTERAKDAKFCSVCGYDYVNNTFAKQYYAFKRERRKNAGKIVKQKFSAAVSSAKVHKKRVITAVLAIVVILAIVVPVSVVFTSPVQPANVDRINIGDTQAHVVSVLGDPYNYKKGDTTFNYYSDNYLNIRKQLDEIANMDDIGSFSDLADALEKEEELNQKLETLEYKRTTVTFDEGGLVTQIVYNASIVDNVSQPKELKSQEVITESVRIYEASDVVYTLKYDDGSIYKSITSVTAYTSNKHLFEVYDPFSESGAKISMECSVVENPDVTYIVGEEGATYLLDQYGNLTISGSGSITSRDISRFDKGEIKQVTIGDNITEIGEGAFSGCALMTSVSIPDSVTKVGRNAFSDCSSLTYRTYDDVRYLGNEGNPYLVAVGIADISAVQFNIHANAKVIADYAFAGNTVLKAAYIPDGSVKYIGARAFYDCTSMTGITLGNGVENIGDNAFSNCNLLTSIAIPGSASIGEYAFSSCYALTSITISDGVTNIGEGAFSSCTEVQKISIPSSLETVGDRIFINYPSVSKVTRIDFNGDLEAWLKVMSLGGMSSFISEDSAIYLNGEQLSGDIIIPEGITSIPSYAFTNFTQITSLTIPDSVTSIGSYILQGCTRIESLIIPNMTRILGGYFGEDPRYDSYNTQVPDSLKTLVITGGESIPQHAFYNCSGLTSITIPDSVTSIGSYAFRGCSGLTSITIPDSVTSIGSGAFRYCSSLTSITIPDSVTSIGEGTFSGCSGLTSITIPDSVTSIGQSAFYNCSGLTDVYYQGDLSGWVKIEFGGYDSNPMIHTDNLYINGELLKGDIIIPEGTEKIGDYVFSYCSSLTSITIPDSVTSIGSYAFRDCSGLTSITIPNSVISIGSSAFYDCDALTIYCEVASKPGDWSSSWNGNCPVVWNCNNNEADSNGNIYYIADNGIRYALNNGTGTAAVIRQIATLSGEIIIPAEITYKDVAYSVTTINASAFYVCSDLTSVTIPDSVTSIGDRAFYNCNALTIYCEVASKPGGWSSSWNYSNCPVVWNCNNNEADSNGNIYYIDESGIRYALNNGTARVIRQIATLSGEIIIPEEITYKDVEYSVTTINGSAFYNCIGLTSITMPNSITSIGYEAFAYCIGLISITIPDSVTSIGDDAFYGCSGLTSITIPDSVTSIGDGAFEDCSGLTSITIPDSVTSIGYGAFSGCSGIIQKENGVSYVDKWVIDCDNTVSQVQLRSNTVGIAN